MLALAAALALLAPAAAAASAAPLLFRVGPKHAAPNDTFIVSGVGLAAATVLLCPLRGAPACFAAPLAAPAWDGGAKVTLPAPPRAFSVRACAAGGGACSDGAQAQRFTVNAPRPAWALGEGGGGGGARAASVAAGGTLRVFGAALALDAASGACPPLRAGGGGGGARAAATVSLCAWPGGGAPCLALAPPAPASCFRLDAAVPAATPPGAYALVVDNGLASSLDGAGAADAPLRIDVFARAAWPAATWRVGTDCGLVDCLAAAAAAGGGTVALPAGVFDVPRDAALALAPRVALVGAGAGASVLRWAANSAAGARAPALACRGGARVRALTLLATSPVGVGLHFAGGAGCEADGVNVTLDVPLDGPPVGAAFAADGATGFSLTNSALSQRGNCSLSWPHNTAYTVWSSADGLVANNSFACWCQSHSTDASTRVAFDGNTVVALGPRASQGGGYSSFGGPLEHIYEGRHREVGNADPALRKYESMTFDGPGGAATGTFDALSSDGTDGRAQTLTLSAPGRAPGPWDKNVSHWVGGSVAVVFGPGLGALARVAAVTPDDATGATARVWTLDPPLVGAVARESVVSITPHRGGLIFEGSEYVNATTFQLWAQVTDCVVGGLAFTNVSGDLRLWPLQYQCPWKDGFACAWQVNVDAHFLDNELTCSRGGLEAVSSDYGATPPADIALGVANSWRGNTLRGGSVAVGGRFADLLIEHTAFAPAHCAGADVPAGAYAINASVPNVLVR